MLFTLILIITGSSLLVFEESDLRFTLQEVIAQQTALPPADYESWHRDKKLHWLDEKLEQSISKSHRYTYQRLMVSEYLTGKIPGKGHVICTKMTILRNDLNLRSVCINMSIDNATYSQILKSRFELMQDAKRENNIRLATSTLIAIAWMQTQNGDIAEALASYEDALDLAKGDEDRTFNIKFNIATIYVIHGNKDYIERGLDLLNKIKREAYSLYEKDKAKNTRMLEVFYLAHFNMGVAYALHLRDYKSAITAFLTGKKAGGSYRIEALTFAAYSASQLGKIKQAKALLAEINGEQSENQIKQGYLDCYQALTKRTWQNSNELTVCFSLPTNTTIEILVDVSKRLAELSGQPEELLGLRNFYKLYIDRIEKELKNYSSKAASSIELKRLELENEFKNQMYQKELALKNAKITQQSIYRRYLIAILLTVVMLFFLILSRFLQKRKMASQFEQLSFKDSLTGMNNRRFFEQTIDREIELVNRLFKLDDAAYLAFYMIDIDHFKPINDNYGHDAGDLVLTEFSRRLKTIIRKSDLLIRWGGEEFLYIARLKTPDEAAVLADRIQETINGEPFHVLQDKKISVTCSIGAVKYPFLEQTFMHVDWQDILKIADSALYWCKQTERNNWAIVEKIQLSNPLQLKTFVNESLISSIESDAVVIKSSFQKNSGS